MRLTLIAFAATSLMAAAAQAQTAAPQIVAPATVAPPIVAPPVLAPPTTMPMQGINGARPGREPGVGESLPRSDRASNIGPETTRPGVAPSLPRPDVGLGAEPEAYLRAARDALSAGKTGLAQEALEMAETQMLHRSMMPGLPPQPADQPMVATIRDARMALGRGNTAAALSILQALPAN